MMAPRERRQTAAWAFLVVATVSSFWTHFHAATQVKAVAVILAIAAVKVIVVLRRFMAAERLSLPLRLYFYLWSIGCATMIAICVAISVRKIG